MIIYIASSWKNQHAVEMLTALLRDEGHVVVSFVENGLKLLAKHEPMELEEWLETDNAKEAFEYDTKGAAESDLVIYISPSGKDAAAEVGIAWANNVPIIGLVAKGEDFGLMRKMMWKWVDGVNGLMLLVEHLVKLKEDAGKPPFTYENIEQGYKYGELSINAFMYMVKYYADKVHKLYWKNQ